MSSHTQPSRRPRWADMPEPLRRRIEDRLGSPVIGAQSCESGFTPAVASALTLIGDTKVFMKAAPAGTWMAVSTRKEYENLTRVGPQPFAPRVHAFIEASGWVALVLEHIDGAMPGRPWQANDLSACSDALVQMAQTLTHSRADGWAPITPFDVSDWDALTDMPHAAAARRLAERAGAVLAGQTVVHDDVRADNMIIHTSGQPVVLDWTHASLGCAWYDSLMLLVEPRRDRQDVEAHIATHPLLSAVPRDDIDAVLASFAGYCLSRARDTSDACSAALTAHRADAGMAVWDWLCERRGWAAPEPESTTHRRTQ